ncbi:MAG: hypothetical protein HC941_12075 [Microcoleus sp. SU_5_3]|nr:hypothetical protein [Microcoleus sp. SU_5_3]
MAHILHIDSSPRDERWRSLSERESRSRRMTREFVKQYDSQSKLERIIVPVMR